MQTDINPEVVYFVSKRCDSNWKLRETELLVCDLTFVLQGHATYAINGKSFVLNKGDAVFIHSGQIREAGQADMRCEAFNFQYTASQRLSLPSVIHWEKHTPLHALLRDYETECTLARPGWELKCRGLFLEILCETWRCAQNDPVSPLVRQIEHYISEHLFEPLTVSEIAAAVGRHANYCGMVFHKEKNCSLTEYIHRLRTEHAIALMREGDLSIGEIALQSGYSDIYYFSRVFKSIHGTAPSAFADQIRKNGSRTH